MLCRLGAKLQRVKKIVDHFHFRIDLTRIGLREPGVGVLKTSAF